MMQDNASLAAGTEESFVAPILPVLAGSIFPQRIKNILLLFSGFYFERIGGVAYFNHTTCK